MENSRVPPHRMSSRVNNNIINLELTTIQQLNVLDLTMIHRYSRHQALPTERFLTSSNTSSNSPNSLERGDSTHASPSCNTKAFNSK